MARLKDIDNVLEGYLQSLKEAYYETDPKNGEDAEIAKHQLAQMAIENFWYLQGKLLSWAQAHMTGYAILSENPDLVGFLQERLGYELYEDSHELEQIGLVYNYNPPDYDDPSLVRMHALLKEFSEQHTGDHVAILGTSALRRTIVELLMSRCADNSYWRMELQNSFLALNEGEVDDLVKPIPAKKQGLPYSLNRWKLEALRQVRFRIGKGYKKYRALEEVGRSLGQSTETLRVWEKELEKSQDRAVDLFCSELAGYYDSFFSGDLEAPAPNREEYDTWRGLNHADNAKYLHQVIVELNLEDIRKAIRHFRQKQNGS